MTTNLLVSHDKYTNDLYLNADSYLKTNHYKNLIDKDEFKTKLTGVTYDNRQDNIRKLEPSQELFLEHDKENQHHKNAIKVITANKEELGFLPRNLADEMIKVIDDNNRLVFVEDVTGNPEIDDFLGVNIVIQKINTVEEQEFHTYPVTMKKEELLESIATDLEFLEVYYRRKEEIDKIVRSGNVSLNGNDEYEKKIMLAIVLLYKYIKYNQKILFLYNDRSAVIEDAKIFQLINSKFDINMQELNLDKVEQEGFVSYMEENNIGMLFTTYVNLNHIQLDYEFGLVVHNHFDHNLKYIQIHELRQLNTKSTVFNHYNYERIAQEYLTDTFGVKNFFNVQAEGYTKEVTLVDKRNIKDKDLFIYNFAIKEQKCLIYTNTCSNAVSIAKRMRSKFPRELKNKIVYYHSGLSIEDRKIIEEKFHSGEYLFVVVTTAFDIALNSENVVKNIFMYNPPYTYNSFLNQIVQTAKYNKCKVYLIYSYRDVHETKQIISSSLTDKSDLMYVYRTLQSMLYEKIQEKFGYFTCKNHQLRSKVYDIYTKQYKVHQLEIVLKTLDEMKVIEFDKKSNDYFITIHELVEKANFENTQTYLKNLIMQHMFVEFELLLLDFNIQNIRNQLFYS